MKTKHEVAEVIKKIFELGKQKEAHPADKAIKEIDKTIKEIEVEIEEEEIQYSCCGDEMTGILKDIQICPTCKEHQ